MGHHGAKLRELERPAGTIETGAATAYDPIIGASQVRSTYNVQGTGMAVAVIDTGVDYNNPALGGGFGPSNKVIAGYDFADNTADPMATSSQHGTAIAGLIGSDDPNDLGVAPGVNIVALRVTDSTNTASLTSVANALQWVINNHAEYNITVGQHVVVRRRELCPELVRQRWRRRPASHPVDRAAHGHEHPRHRGDRQ